MDLKHQVEAALYTLGKFITIEELAVLANATPEQVKEAIAKLKEDYSKRETALTLQEMDNKIKLNIKKEFGHLTNKILSDKELDNPTTKTLAIIAYKNPVKQSEVIKMRGNKSYDHIKKLTDSNLISSEKLGRTRLLKLTSHFYDYFDVSKEEVNEKLKPEEPLKGKSEENNINN